VLEIILVRHGETDWNAGEIFRGRADVALNETGLKQADKLGEYLSGEKIDVIYASPLKRAIKTAEAIAARQGLEICITPNLNDIDCGEWEGRTLEEVKEKCPDVYRDWLDTPEQVRIPGGESLEEVRCRVMPFIEDAVTRCREGRIALVSHRVVNKVIICNMLGLGNGSFWSLKLDTGGITRFELNGARLVLIVHNDTSYLKEISFNHQVDF
jgi:broad specificity phosphatase PhoE